jgi:hypothetical protein
MLFQKWWIERGYPDGIPDEAPYELEAKKLAPSWRRVCKTLLRNDYWGKGIGFSQHKSAAYLKYQELMRRRITEAWEGVVAEQPRRGEDRSHPDSTEDDRGDGEAVAAAFPVPGGPPRGGGEDDGGAGADAEGEGAGEGEEERDGGGAGGGDGAGFGCVPDGAQGGDARGGWHEREAFGVGAVGAVGGAVAVRGHAGDSLVLERGTSPPPSPKARRGARCADRNRVRVGRSAGPAGAASGAVTPAGCPRH